MTLVCKRFVNFVLVNILRRELCILFYLVNKTDLFQYIKHILIPVAKHRVVLCITRPVDNWRALVSEWPGWVGPAHWQSAHTAGQDMVSTPALALASPIICISTEIDLISFGIQLLKILFS